MIISVMSNGLCLVDISVVFMYFGLFNKFQSACEEKYHYMIPDLRDKHYRDCMSGKIKEYKAFRRWADYCGVHLLFAAEIFAVLPYALRSYRI